MNEPKSPTDPATQEFLSREQLAKRWNCSVSTVKRIEAARALNPVRLSKRTVRYSIEAIEGYEKTR